MKTSDESLATVAASVTALKLSVTRFDQDRESLAALTAGVTALNLSVARSEQDRIEIHRTMQRIDESKASKEMVDAFRGEFATLRGDIDKRFDKLERLLEGSSRH